jgi:2-haloacid dehalogenase
LPSEYKINRFCKGNGMFVKGVIFDLGGVVVDWNPLYVFREVFAGDAARMAEFFTKICPQSWNEKQDAGFPIAQATAERVARYPAWEKEIRAYYGRWIEMVGGPIPGTSELIDELAATGVPQYALSNWSAELFPLVRGRFAAFTRFEKIFLSGDYQLIKPDARFYRAALAEIHLPPESLVFVDDNQANIAGAEAVGLSALHFTGAEKLRADLRALGLRV